MKRFLVAMTMIYYILYVALTCAYIRTGEPLTLLMSLAVLVMALNAHSDALDEDE